MTTVERVAEAIERAELGNNWTDMARAAIMAMREPTEEMIIASVDYVSIRARWRAMIDAALNESETGDERAQSSV